MKGPRSRIPRVRLVCDECGKDFTVSPAEYRKKQKRNKTDNVFCSNKCYYLYRGKDAFISTRQERIKGIDAKIAQLNATRLELQKEIEERERK